MTDRKFIEVLNKILARKTGYNNSFPYNLGYYHSSGVQTFDCWNLIKAICWTNGTIADNYTVGKYAIYNPASGLGDWTGKQILDHCSEVSGDMSDIDAGEYLLYEGDGHAGVYVGDGHVIECTVGWGMNCVMQSDIDGSGRSFYRGVQRGRWYRHGKLPFVEYTTFSEGDVVTINDGAKVYGTNIYFAKWVYGQPLTITQLLGDRAVVNNKEYCIGAVSTNDLTPYKEPETPEPFHPATPVEPPEEAPKPPDTEPEPTEPINWFEKYVIGLIRGLFETIAEIFGGKKNA